MHQRVNKGSYGVLLIEEPLRILLFRVYRGTQWSFERFSSLLEPLVWGSLSRRVCFSTIRIGLHFLFLYEEIEHLRLDEEFDEVQVRFVLHSLQEALLLELAAVPAALDVFWEMTHALDEDAQEGLWHQPVQLVCSCQDTQQQEMSGTLMGSGGVTVSLNSLAWRERADSPVSSPSLSLAGRSDSSSPIWNHTLVTVRSLGCSGLLPWLGH